MQRSEALKRALEKILYPQMEKELRAKLIAEAKEGILKVSCGGGRGGTLTPSSLSFCFFCVSDSLSLSLSDPFPFRPFSVSLCLSNMFDKL